MIAYFDDEREAAINYDKYVMTKFGPDARTNDLISFDDIVKKTLTEKIKKIIPKGITYRVSKESYGVELQYKKVKYRSEYTKSLDRAIILLKEYRGKIQKIKDSEETTHQKREIIRNSDGIAVIRLKNKSKFYEILVDDGLWHEMSNYSWSLVNGYAITDIKNNRIFMHHFVHGKTCDLLDHINHNRLDNRRGNLRENSRAGNSHNRKKLSGCSSQYFGVSAKRSNWVAGIKKNGVQYKLGTFDDERDAARAYNEKAQELYGEFANLNIID